MSVLLDLTPEGDKRPPVTDFKPEPAPSTTTLLARTAASMVTRPLSAARIATGLGRSLPLVGSYLTPYVGAILGGGHGDGEVINHARACPPDDSAARDRQQRRRVVGERGQRRRRRRRR